MVNATVFAPHTAPSSTRQSSLLTSFTALAKPASDDDETDADRATWSGEGSPVESEYGSDEPSDEPSDLSSPPPSHPLASSTTFHSPPESPCTKPKPPISSLSSLSSSNNHLYRSAPRARPRGLTPMTPVSTLPAPPHLGHGISLPKSQPLARALFARMANDVPHAGTTGGKKKSSGQKIIVPTKAFRTTFELDLTASELARKA